MIGILSKDHETRAIREFFELFKTPWEFYSPERAYDIVIVTSEEFPPELNARVLAIYNSRHIAFDDRNAIATRSIQGPAQIDWKGVEFPVYGPTSAFQRAGRPFLHHKASGEVAGMDVCEPGRRTLRIGYDLFEEVIFLLSHGQPAVHAQVPTLDIHISLLRSIMLNAEIDFVEVPPVPAGYDFMACLSHDVDFTGIREHMFDHTMWGFLYRATLGSLQDFIRRDLSWSKCAANWRAAVSLPFVYLGWVEDFWLEFDRYLEIEKGLHATYFFIPFKDCPGTLGSGPAPKPRAAKYDVSETREELQRLIRNGCEIGLHGIDSWHDAQRARVEAGRIRELTGQSNIGIRMHWLYFSEDSPAILERAGFRYDSTFGYNDALGFRGGTTQAFSPIAAMDLLELPLNIQDTAMFYPGRMNLSEAEAMESCEQLIKSLATFGGVLTVNWHTRSLSPERLWGDFYLQLLKKIQEMRVWFATADEIVSWFRRRRALRFESVELTGGELRLKMAGPSMDGQPPFVVRLHSPSSNPAKNSGVPASARTYSDTPWTGEMELRIGS